MGKKKTAVSKKRTPAPKAEKSKAICKLYGSKEEKAKFLKTYNEKYDKLGFSTRAIHYGQPPDPFYGSVNMPIHLTSTFAQYDAADPYFKFDYGRVGNPTREALEQCVGSLEGGKHCLAFSAGCACTMIITHLLKSGDHIVCVDDVYGGTGRFFRRIASEIYGMSVDFVDMTNLDNLKKAIKKNTKLVWLETPTNPTLKCIDIQEATKICKKAGVISVVDNTFLSPVFQQPLKLGADIVMHSGTKYLAGHADVVMGFVITNNKEIYDKLFFYGYAIGPVPSPFDCYLVLRSLKTLKIRMEAINNNAQRIAEYLETRKDVVEKVLYPGLKSHPHYKIAQKQTKGNAGIVTFIIKNGTVEDSR